MGKHGNINMAALREARRERDLDEAVRHAMGLTIRGFVYVRADWRAAPWGLYVACDGQEYLKRGPGIYVKRDSIAGASLT
jgi:hypothetical protein